MKNEPTYEDLKKSITQLENELKSSRERVAQAQKKATQFRELVELLPETIYEIDLEGNLTFVNRRAFDHFGYVQKDFDQGANAFSMIAEDDWERAKDNILKIISGEKIDHNEYTAKRKDGSTFPARFYSTVIYEQGQPVGVRGFIIDITEEKAAEKTLKQLCDELDQKVKERTAELEIKSQNLEEMNIALRVLLKQREEDNQQFEKRISENLENFILPYLRKVRKEMIDKRQKSYLDIIVSNLDAIISPFSEKLSLKKVNLTPTEVEVADCIRHGKSSREIASLLNTSPKTVEAHRLNIRKKLNLTNKKINLKTFLSSGS